MVRHAITFLLAAFYMTAHGQLLKCQATQSALKYEMSGNNALIGEGTIGWHQAAERKVAEVMDEEEARTAIINLLKAYPKLFKVEVQHIEKADIQRKDDIMKISFFHCDLRKKTFVYVVPAGVNTRPGIEGRFLKDSKGIWTGEVTTK